MKTLVTWIATHDLNAAAGTNQLGPGPIASALDALTFERIVLLANVGGRYTREEIDGYVRWLVDRSPQLEPSISLKILEIDNPTDFDSIYRGVDRVLTQLKESTEEGLDLTYHLSPGTSQMAAVWMFLSQTKHPATLIQSSTEAGVETVELPFAIAAEFVPRILEKADSSLLISSAILAGGALADVTYESLAMRRLMRKAFKAASRSLPVFIEGEPGTEKAQLAQLIHDESPYATEPFVRLSCGAIAPGELEQQLFGPDRRDPMDAAAPSGAIAKARGGTLYIEEVECLPALAQARLQSEIDAADGFKVRLITSSRKNLLELVTNGGFREELFYSLAVIALKIPPLRERQGDLSQLLDHLLARINEQSQSEPGFSPKKLSPAARNFLIEQRWPGNLRELESTLRRAVVWSDGDEVSEADIWDSLLIPSSRNGRGDAILGRPIEGGVELQDLIAEVARHYIGRAIEYSEGNKSQAAKLVGLPSYQTLTNWMKKYEL
jgi:DNA-binding NtrC family response regulator